MSIGYLPNGPTVWRVSYGYEFEQFETLDKSLNYMKQNMENKGKHMLLIRKVNISKVEIFKPSVDTRYDDDMVVSHDDNQIRSTPVPAAANIPILATDVDVVGIDEAQFFDDEIVRVCNDLANRGIRVIVAGVDMDFKGNPFGPLPALMATAEYVTKVHAVCTKTGNLAHYSHRTVQNDDLVLLGEVQEYEPLSRAAYFKAMRKAKAEIESNENDESR